MPWEDRQRLGFVPALVETVKLLVLEPREGFHRAQSSGDLASPILFAILIGWLSALVGQIWVALLGSGFPFMWAPGEAFAVEMASRGLMLLGVLFLAPILVLLGLFFGAGILHLCLLLVGGTERSEAGFEGTLRAVAYSSVTQLAQAVPFVGVLIAVVWSLILNTLGLSILHRTSQAKAFAAVIIPWILCCSCGGTILALSVGGLMMGLSSFPA